MSITKFAKQGVRQPVWKTEPVRDGQILKPGMTFDWFSSSNVNLETLTIPEGTIGIIHVDTVGNPIMPMEEISISVIRDDCKAARKAIRLSKASIEERAAIAYHNKVRDYQLGCNAELKLKVEATFKPVIYTLKERTFKQYTLDDACNTAKTILQSKYNYKQLCVDLLKGKSETELLTTVEMGELVQELVDDTIYWAGGFTTTGPLV